MDYSIAETNQDPAAFSVWLNHKLVEVRKVSDHKVHTWEFHFAVSAAGQFNFEIKGEGSCAGLTIGKVEVSKVVRKGNIRQEYSAADKN